TLLLAVREGVPILVKLAIRKNLGLALRISDLDDARLRRPPMPGPLFEKLAPITRERAVRHEIDPVAIIPAELLSGDILAGHRPAFLLEGTHVAEIPVARQRRIPQQGRREQSGKTGDRASIHTSLPGPFEFSYEPVMVNTSDRQPQASARACRSRNLI